MHLQCVYLGRYPATVELPRTMYTQHIKHIQNTCNAIGVIRYTYMYICMHVHIFTHAYPHTCTCMNVYTYKQPKMEMHIRALPYIITYNHIYIHIHVSIYGGILGFMRDIEHVCLCPGSTWTIYSRMSTYTHAHVCVYTNTRT